MRGAAAVRLSRNALTAYRQQTSVRKYYQGVILPALHHGGYGFRRRLGGGPRGCGLGIRPGRACGISGIGRGRSGRTAARKGGGNDGQCGDSGKDSVQWGTPAARSNRIHVKEIGEEAIGRIWFTHNCSRRSPAGGFPRLRSRCISTRSSAGRVSGGAGRIRTAE